MITYQFGDVVLMRFHPSFGAELKKYRPAIVVVDESKRADKRLVTIVPLTSRKVKNKKFEFSLKLTDLLDKDSTVLAWFPQTLDVERIVKRLGIMPEIKRNKLRKMLLELYS